jgi:hypothetical protein
MEIEECKIQNTVSAVDNGTGEGTISTSNKCTKFG